MRKGTRPGAIMLVILSLFGCGVGHNSVLFMTKSNIGIDVDSRPPTAEISVARREGSFAPAFEKGQTPTLLASFRSQYKGILGMFFNVASTFSGGDAASTMTMWFGDNENKDPTHDVYDSTLCLEKRPSRNVWGRRSDFLSQVKFGLSFSAPTQRLA